MRKERSPHPLGHTSSVEAPAVPRPRRSRGRSGKIVMEPAASALSRERARNSELSLLHDRLLAQLARSEQLAGIGRLVAGLAHELNNPLAALLVTLHLMQTTVVEAEGPAGPEKLGELRAMLTECGGLIDRIKDLIGAVKGMSRDGAKDDTPFDPGRAIRDAVKVFAVANRNHCQVALSLAALPAVVGSPTRLGQVILNLLQNGLDASPARAAGSALLSVTARVVKDTVRINVIDGGPGIPADIAGQVFDPFFTSKGADRGTGLGLSICRDIVDKMGGSIGFESEPGRTVFRIDLPACRPDNEPLT